MLIYLKQITSSPINNNNNYPFNIPIYKQWINIEIERPILIIAWENWTWKSTLLEAIANQCWFSQYWWSQNHHYGREAENRLSKNLKLSWFLKMKKGFFMKAESFLKFSNYIDSIATEDPSIYDGYGWDSLNNKSHWEAFFSLFSNYFRKWIFILDEPESALSPTKQLQFSVLIKKLINNCSQFIIATHSPIIMSIPSSQFMLINNNCIKEVSYKDTQHYKITKLFLDCPERFHKQFKI